MATGSVSQTQSRLPVLDGVRAVAISLVVFCHIFSPYFIRAGGPVTMLNSTGSLGVTVFLVLSGYLITKVMLADEARSGQLRIRRFYARRALRILPAFYGFLAIVALLSIIGILPKPDQTTWLASFCYFRNLAGSGWETGHLWSLSLEEQFYLVWPMLFILTSRFRLRFIACSVLALTIGRFWWVLQEHTLWPVFANPALRMDTFLIGGAFAIARWKWIRDIPVALVVFGVLMWYPFAVASRWTLAIQTPVSAFLIATLIVWLVENPGSVATRTLSLPIPTMLGAISYSVYLWQQLFLGGTLHWWSLPGLAATVAASYVMLERPALRIKDGGFRLRAIQGLTSPLLRN